MYMNIPQHTQRLFWDTNILSADIKKYRDFIITRVADKGGITDLQWLVKNYGKTTIKAVVTKSHNVSAKTKNFWQVIGVINN